MPVKSGNGTASVSERHALDALIRHPRLTRAELARELALTPQAISHLMTRLKDERSLIRESDLPSGRGGQPAKVYELQPPKRMVAVGLDIGHHHARVALCGADGDPIEEPEFLHVEGVRFGDDPAAFFDAARDAILQLLRETKRNPGDVVGIGVAIAGAINPDENMLRAGPKLGPWEAIDLKKELAERFPGQENWAIEVDNDATLGALAEHRSGAAQGHDHVLYIRWTAGIGMGLILGGKPYRGARGIAGELGHIVLPRDRDDDLSFEPKPCSWCDRACLQVLVGTDTIVNDAVGRGFEPTRQDGQKVEVADIIAAAEHNDAAVAALARAAGFFGKALAIVVDVLNPQLVVVGGAFGRNDYHAVVPTIQNVMRTHAIQPALRDVRIVMSHYGSHGGGAVVRGAAMLIFERHLTDYLLA